jgi:hypothetical protein
MVEQLDLVDGRVKLKMEQETKEHHYSDDG